MKNKNIIYIALGLGAGIFAYYYFCKKKYSLNASVEESSEGGELAEKSSNKAVGGGGFGVAPMRLPTPMPVASSVNIINTPVPTVPPERTVDPTPVKPVTTVKESKDTFTVLQTVAPAISTPIDTPIIKPIKEAENIKEPIRTEPVRAEIVSKQLEPVKSGFDGMGQLCFEVGECLNDL
jgi:hypothetical protein